MQKPYIGITGFMSRSEVESILEIMPTHAKRLLMVGVLVSWKTIRGIANKYPNRYPVPHKIAEIFPNNDSALNLIHYNTDEKETLCEQLVALTDSWGGMNLHGYQLNIAWPDPRAIEKYRHVFPDKQIVLQIGKHAFQMIDHSPEQLSAKVKEYDGLIHYVLLDPSGGHGELLDVEKARQYLDALTETKMDIGLGVAGGLSPMTLNHIVPLIQDFPNLSIDAEGRLRDTSDNLHISIALEYLDKFRYAFALTSKV